MPLLIKICHVMKVAYQKNPDLELYNYKTFTMLFPRYYNYKYHSKRVTVNSGRQLLTEC